MAGGVVNHEPITRPNGKVYRARKPPRAVMVEPDDSNWREHRTFVYVLGHVR